MRLRTLPVSVAGVFIAAGCAAAVGTFRWQPVMLCLTFAVLAQIASNFANEYYDFAAGLDKKGREGPRRGVTEGDITPRSMLIATYLVLAAACIVGLSLLFFGGWWLIPMGLLIALGVMAYSTGPYPLSRHGLGEVAVIGFFGLIPVTCTYILQGGILNWHIVMAGLSAGLMGANVLIVNNYRDIDDDKTVGKLTLAVILGRKAMRRIYRSNAVASALLMIPWWRMVSVNWAFVPVIYCVIAFIIAGQMKHLKGHQLNPFLGRTAILMLAVAFTWCIAAATSSQHP